MVLVDYQKAFDMVDQERLLKNLEAYGEANQELSSCRSHLSSIKQVLCFSRTESYESLAKPGVPLGSILAPLVFTNIFINDLPFYVSFQIDL